MANNEEAQQMLSKFQRLSLLVQQAKLQGKEPEADLIRQLTSLREKIELHPLFA